MIVKCCVPGCMDRSARRHRFPNPTKDRLRFEKWIELIGNTKLVGLDPIKIFNNRRVCHVHFDESVHTTNMYNTKTSLTSLNLPTPPATVEIDSVPEAGNDLYLGKWTFPIDLFNYRLFSNRYFT